MKTRVLLFAAQVMGRKVLDFLNNHDEIDVVGVIASDKERDRVFSDKLLHEYCFSIGVPCISGKVDCETVTALDPDIIVSAYYRHIIGSDILDAANVCSINIHPGLLPEDRGANPSYWNIIHGDERAGTTLHFMSSAMDAGDIIANRKIAIPNTCTGFELHNTLTDLGHDMFVEEFDKVLNNTNDRIPQCQGVATCNVMFRNNFRYIDWNKPAQCVLDHIRAHTEPYAGSLAWTADCEIAIYEAELSDQPRGDHSPGYIRLAVPTVLPDGRLGCVKFIIETNTTPIIITKWEYSDNTKYKNLVSGKRLKSGVP